MITAITLPINLTWHYHNASAATSSDDIDEIRYRSTTQDKYGHPKELRCEQKELFIKHYPIGNMIPFHSRGATLKEIMESTRNYCVIHRINISDVEVKIVLAVGEMIAENMVERVTSDES